MKSSRLCRLARTIVATLCLLGAVSGRGGLAAGTGPIDPSAPQRADQAKSERFYERFFGRQLPVSAVSRIWRITMDGSEPCNKCPGGRADVFTAVKREGGESYQIRLTKPPGQVDELDVVGESRLAVFGRNTTNAALVNVLELPGGTELDSFMCYDPSLSPDHRFLAYLKLFPGHPGPVDITNEYVVYDLTQSPASNRFNLRQGVGYDAGMPVYPPGATNATGEFVASDEWSAHVLVSEGLFWLGQTDAVAFADRWRGAINLVVADVSQGVRQPKVEVHPLDSGKIVDMASCRNKVAPSDFDNWYKDPASLVSVTDIALAGADAPKVRLTLAPHTCLTSNTVEVLLGMRPSTPVGSR